MKVDLLHDDAQSKAKLFSDYSSPVEHPLSAQVFERLPDKANDYKNHLPGVSSGACSYEEISSTRKLPGDSKWSALTDPSLLKTLKAQIKR